MIFSKLFSHISDVHRESDSYYEIKLGEQGNATTVMFSSDRSFVISFSAWLPLQSNCSQRGIEVLTLQYILWGTANSISG